MRISDWSSDVCSSDLCAQPRLCSRRKIVLAVVRRSATLRPLRSPAAEPQNASIWRRDCPDDARAASRLRAVPATPRSHGCVRHRSEEHTSELQSLMRISYAVFCLQTKKINKQNMMRSHIEYTYN